MKKKFVLRALIVMSMLLIIGIILIFSSGVVGENVGSAAIQSNGGSMDTESYQRIVNTTTVNFQITGSILSIVGGFGVLLSGNALYKEL